MIDAGTAVPSGDTDLDGNARPEAGTAPDMGAYESAYVPLTPTISITTGANGAIYTRGQAVSAAYTCTPGVGTSIGSCTASASVGALIDKSTLGAHTFTVTADDADGVRATASATYTVTQAPTLTVPVLTAVGETARSRHEPGHRHKKGKTSAAHTLRFRIVG